MPSLPSISVIVPTYREAENLPGLLERIGSVKDASGLDLEVLIMDDDSGDGTEEVVKGLGLPWVELVIRRKDRGLSRAVMDGFDRARNDVLLCMDADLSHPPEKIPELVEALEAGHDFALGSRWVAGGGTDDEWGVFRWLNSVIAGWLARPLTSVKDPMSGFFALRREQYAAARESLNPVGYKIGLELLIKCRCKNAKEIPIHFADRQHGESKLTIKEQLRYLRHLARLYRFRLGMGGRG